MVTVDPSWSLATLDRADTAAGGDGPSLRLAALATPIGGLLAGFIDDRLALLTYLDTGRPEWNLANVCRWTGAVPVEAEAPGLEALRAQLAEYFAGPRRSFDLPLADEGSDFQRAVWAALRAIPYGQTRSYGQVAAAVGNPRACRAVGAANGANPLLIVTPCHRVVRTGGALGGFGAGLPVKARLLALEGVEIEA